MIEVLFINHNKIDCKPFHDAILKHETFNGKRSTLDTIKASLDYIKRGGNFILIITLDDIKEDFETLKEHILANDIPYILRYKDAYININKFGKMPNIVNYPTEYDDAVKAFNFCFEIAIKKEGVSLPNSLIKMIKPAFTNINSSQMWDKRKKKSRERNSEITIISNTTDGLCSDFDGDYKRYCRTKLKDMITFLTLEGFLKVHASHAVCLDKILKIDYDEGYILTMPNNIIKDISRSLAPTVVPIITAIMDAKGMVIGVRG